MEYPKIPTLFTRDPKTHKVNVGEYSHPVFGTIDKWDVYEKIDGMNIRIIWEIPSCFKNGVLTFGGRTDNAQIPAKLLPYLNEHFTVETMKGAFPECDFVTIFGEGYGAGIQNGGKYNPEQRFRVFDVMVGEWWLKPEDVDDVAQKLDIRIAPRIGLLPLSFAVERARAGCLSLVDVAEGEQRNAEGIVARPVEQLYFRNGDRVMWKLKTKDFV